MAKIETIGGDVMKQAIGAYRTVTATDEFRQLERMRADARNREASALGHARREGEKAEREKWQGVVANKDAAIADKDAALADKDAAIAEQAAEIEKLRAQLANQGS